MTGEKNDDLTGYKVTYRRTNPLGQVKERTDRLIGANEVAISDGVVQFREDGEDVRGLDADLVIDYERMDDSDIRSYVAAVRETMGDFRGCFE